jgi:hypothetical protein
MPRRFTAFAPPDVLKMLPVWDWSLSRNCGNRAHDRTVHYHLFGDAVQTGSSTAIFLGALTLCIL